ncbi:MAG TPA: hypothetical protein VJ672_01805 [Gemmatimonadaceae bacterium]|nr:hypothetical protein [Gemmatimonadaceae bacterium]
MHRAFVKVVGVALALALAGCSSGTTSPDGDVIVVDGTVRGTGVVHFYNLEGGFFAIRGDDNVTYDPMEGMPESFRQDGLRVRFEGKVRDDMASIHMVGRIIELLDIDAE